MGNTEVDFHVLGIGHLAAAVRVQLHLRARQVSEALPYGACGASPSIVLACGDYESPSSFADANRRAVGFRSRILFAWISGNTVRVGPLVVPLETPCFECRPRARCDFSLSDANWSLATADAFAIARAPPSHLQALAQFGALLVARELAYLQFGAPFTRLVGRVINFEPGCLEAEVAAWRRASGCPACGLVSGSAWTGCVR